MSRPEDTDEIFIGVCPGCKAVLCDENISVSYFGGQLEHVAYSCVNCHRILGFGSL